MSFLFVNFGGAYCAFLKRAFSLDKKIHEQSRIYKTHDLKEKADDKEGNKNNINAL